MYGGTVTVANTMLANSSPASDCTGPITDDGGNFADDGTCGFTSSSSTNRATGLNLGSLASNGGPTQTIALGSGSSAIGHGVAAYCADNLPTAPGATAPYGAGGVDQRGDPRGGLSDLPSTCDSGAYDTGDVTDTTVTNTNASGPGSLPYVVANAGAGSTIKFRVGGTITLASTITLSKSVTIDGGRQPVTISGGGSVQVFTVSSGVTATLQNLAIANGQSANGGGVKNNGTLNVVNSTFSGNNSPNGRGGAIYNYLGSTLRVANSIFINNTATSGYGGGIYNYGSSTLSVANSTFTNNSATAGGGGAISNAGTLNVANSTFNDNSGGGSSGGGGIENLSGTANVANSTFSSNSAPSGFGGGIFINNGTVNVANSTLSGNSATGGGGGGGGIFINSGTMSMANTILANSSSGGDCSGTVNDNGGNLADDGTCGFTAGSSANNNPTLNLGTLWNWGGPTETIALGSGSSAIRHGVTSYCRNNLPTASGATAPYGAGGVDQRGDTRSGLSNATPTCDSGAYDTGDATTGGDAIGGTVYALSNAPANVLAGATVQVCLVNGGPCQTATTGASGQYLFTGLPDGSYYVTANPVASATLSPGTLGPLAVSGGATLSGQNLVLGSPIPPPAGTTLSGTGSSTTAGGVPIVSANQSSTLTTSGCAGGTASYQISLQAGLTETIVSSGLLTEGSPGTYTAPIPALQTSQSEATVTITLTCPGSTMQTSTFNVFIDPSGVVQTVSGAPIAGATVTLYSAPSASGPFTAVPNGSSVMSPANQQNPTTSGSAGLFGWDVLAGYYQIRAAAPGCVAPGNPSQAYVQSPVLTVPPSLSTLVLTLSCSVPAQTIPSQVYGQGGSFTANTANNGGVSATSLSYPFGVALDGSGGLYVADTNTNRVLYYPAGSTTASRVYGQPSFSTNTANNGGVSATSLFSPQSVAVDGSGGLYVADQANNRVLYYPVGSTTSSRVYGQPSFTTNTANTSGVSATSLNQPNGVAVDGSGGLYVSDEQNNRVLYYPAGSTTATRVYGQPSFTTNTANNGGVSATSLNLPFGMAVDGNGNLYVTDISNNRVLYYPAGSTTASRVYGQPNFTANNAGVSATSLYNPQSVAVDGGGALYVADFGNSRVLYYPAGSTTASQVYGQPNFTANTRNNGGVSATSLNLPSGVAVDSSGDLYVADSYNQRVLYYPAGLTALFLYPRLDLAHPTLGTLPASYHFGVWDAASSIQGPNAKSLATTPGTAQQASATGYLYQAGDASPSMALDGEFLSAPLAAQTIPAGGWSVGLGIEGSLLNAGKPDYTGYLILNVINGSTGQVRGTLVSAPIGAEKTTEGSEVTAYQAGVQGATVMVQAGDYLEAEIGVRTLSYSAVQNTTLFTSGTTPLTTDGAGTSNAASIIQAPVALTFQ
jgi:hypothetical protein